ncbi:MAG: AAA family ATPase [Alphaproteobacteria bacterium]|nr:AAA family ATPase [Alphaproteobacteria bacterium]
MQITLKNVGAIRSATVSLNGLAVIAGPNESGKTTVGKTLYAAIKALKEHNLMAYQEKIRNIRQSFIEISAIIRKSGAATFDSIGLFSGESHKRTQLGELLYKIIMATDDIPDEFLNCLKEDNFVEAIRLADNYKNILVNNLTENNRDLAVKHIDWIIYCLQKHPTFYESFSSGLLKMYRDVFSGQVTNIYTNEPAKVSINNVLNYTISSGLSEFDIEHVDEDIIKQAIAFSDVTFIESPLILQYRNTLRSAPHYWNDLIDKLRITPELGNTSSLLNKEINALFTEIMGGELVYNTREREFTIDKYNTSAKLSFNNAASGIKEFGILQRMARLELFSGNNLIVLDEPENHLHTAWQVKLAEVIIELVKNGVSVLITSHSPDFIQTLRVEADKQKLETDKAKFYLSEESEKTQNITKYDIIDKTGREADILENLSIPMDNVYDYIMKESMNQ